MILQCPECSTKFKVNPQAIPPAGRMVKCAKCGHKWHAMPEGDAEDAFPDLDFDSVPPTPSEPEPAFDEEPADPVPEPEPPLPRAPEFEDGPPPISPANFAIRRAEKPKRKFGPATALLVLILLILAGAGALYVYREQVVLAYPPSQKVYHALGIDAAIPGYGLDLASKKATIDVVKGEDGQDDLVVTGYMTNPTAHSIVVPYIKGELRDRTGSVIYHWSFRPDLHEILPGEEATFTAHIDNPPPGGTRIDFITQTDEEAMGPSGDKEHNSTH